MVGPEFENGEIEEWHENEHAKANQIEDCSCQERALQLNPSCTCVSVEICQAMSEGGTGQKKLSREGDSFPKKGQQTSPEQLLSSNAEEIGSAVVRIEDEEPTTGQTNGGQGKNQQSPHLCWR